MIELFGIQFGTPFQGATLLTLLALLGVWWVRGIPDRVRANNETKVIDNAEVALRFKEWRAEVHGMKNELAIVKAELHESNAQRARNRDRFNMVLFILRLVMAELRRIDPQSSVIKQADELLSQVTEEEGDPRKSTALNTAEHAVEDAKQTVRSAKATCEEVQRAEEGEK